MDCSLPGSSVHGIFQARVLEWVAISFSRGSSWPRDRTWVSCIAGRRFINRWLVFIHQTERINFQAVSKSRHGMYVQSLRGNYNWSIQATWVLGWGVVWGCAGAWQRVWSVIREGHNGQRWCRCQVCAILLVCWDIKNGAQTWVHVQIRIHFPTEDFLCHSNRSF